MAVYFIRAGDTSAVKIGSARDVRVRLPALQCSNHEPLSVIRTTDGGKHRERWFHSYFRDLWRANEWFNFSPEMLTVVPHGHLGALATWMDEAGVAQLDLMIALNVTNRTTCSWLRGDDRPTAEQAQEIAKWSEGRIPVEVWAA